MGGPAVSFGFNVPTFAGAPTTGDEPTHVNVPLYGDLDWDVTRRAILAADALGFDGIWAPDHLVLGVEDAEYEVWTLLSTIATMVDRPRVGTLVLCNDFRSPALLAKMAATLDVIADGRLTLGLGAGWHRREYEAYGFPYREDFDRLMRLDESIQLIKRMWTTDPGEGVTFNGDHYTVEDAPCAPRPVQDPHPPFLVGGAGESVTLKLVARHADAWNTTSFGGAVPTLEHKLAVLRDHCRTVGRRFEDIDLTWETLVLCTHDEALLEDVERLVLPRPGPDGDPIETRRQLQAYVPFGTPEECAASLERRIELGFTTFQCWFLDYPSHRGMELFADEVIPAVS